MKKCIYFLASFIMAFGLLTACGGGTDSQGTANVGNVTNSAQGNVSSSNLGSHRSDWVFPSPDVFAQSIPLSSQVR